MSKSMRAKSIAMIVALAFVFTTVFAGIGSVAFAAGSNRLAGNDRYETAVEISKAGWTSSDDVVLVSGQGFADALAAGPLAKKLDAPILLTQKNVLPDVTKAEIARLGATKVYIVGGTGVVSDAAAKATGKTVERIAGADRFETAVAVAQKIRDLGGSVDKVVLARSDEYADALAAAAAGIPILFTETTALNDTTKAALSSLGVSSVDIVGGTGAVSDAVKTAVEGLGKTVVRVAGADRESTALEVAKAYAPSAGYAGAIIVTGYNYPDALAAGPFAAKNSYALILSNANSVKAEILNYVNDNIKTIKVGNIFAVGGEKIVSQDVLDAVVKAATPPYAENAYAVTTEVENPIEGYTDVVMLGKPAMIKAKVVDKNGLPVANAAVAFTITDEWGAELQFLVPYVVTTDSNGVATAAIDTKDRYDVRAWNEIASAKYQAAVVGTNVKTEGTVRFAAVNISSVTMVKPTADKLVPSTNSNIAPLSTTNDMVASDVEYVNSQQVSKAGGAEHAITFDATPELVIPPVPGAVKTAKYHKDINYKSGAYHPYDVKKVEIDVPAGLLYATLNFDKIQISKYSELTITTYVKGTSSVVSSYTISGPYDQANFSYQIPIQENAEETVVVKLTAPGQVQTDMNGGFEIASIDGVYAEWALENAETKSLTNAKVTWEKVDIRYSEVEPLASGDAQELLGTNYNDAYVYSYRVPVFPYVGNAVIVGKDANGVERQYFVWPTVNEPVYNGSNITGYKNINVLKPQNTGETAILVTKDEALNSVGTISQANNQVTVNSTAVGYTAVKGTIEVPGVDESVLNDANNTVYTSVQWAPLPNAVAARDTAYAIAGQKIVINAQLTDVNGNAVADSGIAITWSYDNGTISSAGAIGTTGVSVESISTSTDASGQAKLVVLASEAKNLKGLTAKAGSNYNVTLKIGDQNIKTADLKWVDLGLSFDPTLAADDETGPVFRNAATVANVPQPKVGTNWEYGYKVYWQSADKDADGKPIRGEVKGMAVDFTKLPDTVGSMNAVAGTASFTATSTQAGIESVKGALGQPPADITFTVNNVTYKNAGTGTPSCYSEVTLPIKWQATGTQVTFTAPAGNTIAAGSSTDLYVKVTDKFGNPLAGKSVDFAITGIDSSTSVTTDANGVAKVTVRANTTGSSTVVATVKDGNTVIATASYSINWVTAQGPDFALVNIGINKSGANDVLVLTFSQPVKASSVWAEQFTVSDGNNNHYAVKSAEVNGNVVYLTMADRNAKLPDGSYSVSIAPFTPTSGVNAGITFNLVDNYGRTVSNAANPTLKLPAAPSVVLAYDDTTKTITVTAKDGTTGVNGVTVVLVASDPALFTGATDATGTTIEPADDGIIVVTTGSDGTATVTLNPVASVSANVTAYYNGTFASKTVTVQVQ